MTTSAPTPDRTMARSSIAEVVEAAIPRFAAARAEALG